MKFDDLEVGMIINQGLITFLRKANSGEPHWGQTGEAMDAYWEDKDAVACFMHEDAYIGQGIQSHDPDDDYTEMFERGSKAYIDCMGRMMRERQRAASDANEDVILIEGLLLANLDGKDGG